MHGNGDAAGHDHKRLRMQAADLLNHPKQQSKFSEEAKGKFVMEDEEALLLVKIISAVDIDRQFRSVTHERFYGVLGWINPGEEYRTQPSRPDGFNFDPVWNETLMMPLGETSLEDATLHLDVLRASRTVLDPGTSDRRRLVGRVKFRMDQMKADRVVKLSLGLMQPGEFGWKPEGHIHLEMQLMIIPTEEHIELSDSE